MELLLIFVVLAAIRLIILDSRISMLKEDKRFLIEENILLRNDVKRMISVIENLTENRKNNNGSVRSHEARQERKKSKDIFIFNDGESEESQKLRNFLKKNSINGVMLIDFEVLSSRLSIKDDAVIEESFLIEKNRDNLSIIFYGGNQKNFELFLSHCNWKGRKDVEWIKNPFEMEELKQAIKEIRNK